jgi:hypothetical protein
MFGFKIRVLGTNTNYSVATKTITELDAIPDKIDVTFDVYGINRDSSYDIETVRALDGRNLLTSKIGIETFKLDVEYQTFKQQETPATYEANRFNEDLFNKKFFWLIFHNTNDLYDYTYLPSALTSTTILTHGLQVNYLSKGSLEQSGSLYKWSLNFETSYPIN